MTAFAGIVTAAGKAGKSTPLVAVPAYVKFTVCGKGFGFGREMVTIEKLQPSTAKGFAAGMLLVDVTLVTVAASETKLPASRNTPESSTPSYTSAMANFMW